MARKDNDDQPTAQQEEFVPMSVLTSVLERLTALQEQQTRIARAQLKNAPRRRKTLAEFKKENKHQFKYLIRPVFQNNRKVDPYMLSAETLALIDTIAPGRYGNGMLTVARVGEQDQSRIHLLYSNKTIEQRMAFAIVFPTMNDLVAKVHAEMAQRGIQPINDPAPPFAVEDDEEDNEDELAGI